MISNQAHRVDMTILYPSLCWKTPEKLEIINSDDNEIFEHLIATMLYDIVM